MKLEQIKEKVTAFIDRIGKKTVIIGSASIVLVGVIILNLILFMPDKGEEGMKPGLDLGDLSGSGEVNNGEENVGKTDGLQEYFASVAVDRQSARDEAIEVLQAVIDNNNAIAELKNAAIADIAKIAENIEDEVNIETLIKSRGFENCIAVINGSKISIIIESEELLPSELAQITEIVYEQSGILPANMNIYNKQASV